MRDRIARIVMVVAAVAVFFALVCPLAADPIAVGKVKRLSDMAAPALSALPPVRTQFSPQPAAVPFAQPPMLALDLTELSCIRTC